MVCIIEEVWHGCIEEVWFFSVESIKKGSVSLTTYIFSMSILHVGFDVCSQKYQSNKPRSKHLIIIPKM